MAVLPSSEPSSTSSSSQAGYVWASTLAIASSMNRSALRKMTTTETSGSLAIWRLITKNRPVDLVEDDSIQGEVKLPGKELLRTSDRQEVIGKQDGGTGRVRVFPLYKV